MLSAELKDKVEQLIKSEITIEQLEDWLVPRLPSFLKYPDSDNADLVAGIELGLAEMSHGIRTKEEMFDMLQEELRKYNTILVTYPDSDTQITTDTSNTSSQHEWKLDVHRFC